MVAQRGDISFEKGGVFSLAKINISLIGPKTKIMPYKVLIVDDESAARIRMRQLISEYATDFQIIGEAYNGMNAIHQIESLRPDLVFLDIQMPDKNGFEVLAALSYQPMVVFTTAYEQYAIQAFEVHSVDYLVKPIESVRLAKTIQKLNSFHTPIPQLNYRNLANIFQQLQPKKEPFSLTVKKGDRILLLRFEEITYLQAEDKYVTIHTVDGTKHLSDLTLNELVQKLGPSFMRIHRSTIINQDFILEAKRFFKGRFIITLRDGQGTNLRTSAAYSEEIKQTLGI